MALDYRPRPSVRLRPSLTYLDAKAELAPPSRFVFSADDPEIIDATTGEARTDAPLQATVNAETLENAIPEFIASLYTSWDLTDSLTGSLQYYRTAEVRHLGSGGFGQLPEQGRFDFHLRWQFRSGELSWLIENLEDATYQDYYAYNQATQRTYISLKLDF